MSDLVRLRRNAPLGSTFPVVGGASYLPLWGQGGAAPRAAQLVAQTEIFQRFDVTISAASFGMTGAVGDLTVVITAEVHVYPTGVESAAAIGNVAVTIPVQSP